ncbi:hypothetical protein J1N35_007683, partial [Gossypium stocksii]
DQIDPCDPGKIFKILGPYAYVGLHAQNGHARVAYMAWPKNHILVWHACIGPHSHMAYMSNLAKLVWPTRPHSHRHTAMSYPRPRVHQSHSHVSHKVNHMTNHMLVWHQQTPFFKNLCSTMVASKLNYITEGSRFP